MTEWTLGLPEWSGEARNEPDLAIELKDVETGKTSRVTHWTEYRIVQDMMSPADSFDCTLSAIEPQRSLTSTGGQRAQVFSYGALQITAYVDERSEATKTVNTDLNITGRGVGGLLIDSAVPSGLLSMANLTLQKVVQRITEPWQPEYITSVTTNNAGSRYIVSGSAGGSTKARFQRVPRFDKDGLPAIGIDGRQVTTLQKIPSKKTKGAAKKFGKKSPYYAGIDQDQLRQTRIQPGERVWDVIDRLSKQIGAHAWVGADGSIIIARPQYDFDPSAYGEGIQLHWDRTAGRATGGNVQSVQFETSIANRHSETVAWGTGKSKKNQAGKQVAQKTITVKDPSPAFWERQSTAPYLTTNRLYKPDLVKIQNVQDRKLVRRMIRSQLEQKIIESFSLDYQLPGHFAPTGVLWTTDSMVNIRDDRNGLNDSFYIRRVERKYSLEDGKTTILSVIPPRIWLYLNHDDVGDDEYLEHMVQRVWW